MVVNAHAGTRYGIPFPVFARAAFGLRGTHVPSVLRAVVACGWFGIQTWVGGLAILALLGSIWPGFRGLGGEWRFMDHSAAEFLSFAVFWVINLYFVWAGTESIKWLETVSAPVLIALSLALLAWGASAAGGVGAMLAGADRLETTGGSGRRSPTLLPWITAMVGYWATLSLNIPDFTRFARSQRDQVVGQALGLLTTMPFIAFVGVAVTGATVVAFGEAVWNPVDLLARLAAQSGSPLLGIVAMAAVLVATLTTNIAANIVAPANSFSNLAPARISFRTGGLIAGALGVADPAVGAARSLPDLADQLLRAARRGRRRAAGRLRGDSPRGAGRGGSLRRGRPLPLRERRQSGGARRDGRGHHRRAGRPGRPGLAAAVRRGLVLGRDRLGGRVSCADAAPARRTASIRGAFMKIYDLSQPLNQECSFWPFYPPFEVKYIKRKAEHGVNAQYIMTSNHMGTHLDAPRHFVTAGMTIDEIPVEWLCGPGALVDLSDAMDDFDLYTPKMIEDRVEVKKGDLLFLHTGWHRFGQFGNDADEERYIHRHPGRASRHGAVAAGEGHPHLGRGLHLDRPPDEPADRPLPRQGRARPLRPRARGVRGEVRRPRGRGAAVSRLGLPADPQRALPKQLHAHREHGRRHRRARSCRTSA